MIKSSSPGTVRRHDDRNSGRVVLNSLQRTGNRNKPTLLDKTDGEAAENDAARKLWDKSASRQTSWMFVSLKNNFLFETNRQETTSTDNNSKTSCASSLFHFVSWETEYSSKQTTLKPSVEEEKKSLHLAVSRCVRFSAHRRVRVLRRGFIHLLSALSRGVRRLRHLQRLTNWDLRLLWLSVPLVKGSHKPPNFPVLPVRRQHQKTTWFLVESFRIQISSDPPGGVRVLCPVRSCVRWAGSSGFLGAGGQNHGGGQTVDTQSRDVDLITAVGGKLRRDRNQTSVKNPLILLLVILKLPIRFECCWNVPTFTWVLRSSPNLSYLYFHFILHYISEGNIDLFIALLSHDRIIFVPWPESFEESVVDALINV